MSNINANATVTLTVNGKQAQDMLDGLKKKSQDLEKAIENAAKAGNKQQLTRLQRELRQTNRQIAQIESATVGVEKVLRNLDKATPKELNKTLSTLKKQLNGIERGTTEWNRQCEAIKRVKHELERVNADLREGEGRWQRFNRIVNDWQATIMGAAAAVTGLIMAGRAAVKAYADMDAEMANVRKYTGMTADQVADLNEEFKKMDTRTSREDLNRLAEEAGRLGKTSKEDILGFVKAADQINVALDELGEGATLTLSKLTAIFGDEQRLGTEKALLAVGSVINELSQNCTAGAGYLANFAKRMAGVGAQAKMTIPEIMGFAAVLDSQGQAVEMSATAVSKLIMDMFKQQDKVIKATGINAAKFKEALTRDTNEGLLMLLERLHELGNIDVLAPVFKDMGENGARAAQVISALAGNIDMVKKQQQEASRAFDQATSVTKEYNVQNNTVQAQLDKARKGFNEMAAALGQKLMPVMRYAISGTSALMRVMSVFVDFIIKYKAAIITFAISWTVYKVAVNASTIALRAHYAWLVISQGTMKALSTATLALKVAFFGLTGQIGKAKAAYTAFHLLTKSSPWGLILSAVTAVVAGIAHFVNKTREANQRLREQREEMAKWKQSLTNIDEASAQFSANEITRLKALYKEATNEALSKEKRIEAAKRLQQLYPSVFGNLTTEAILTGQAAKQYRDLTSAIIASARARAAAAKIEENEKELLALEGTLETQREDEQKKTAHADQVQRQADKKKQQARDKAQGYALGDIRESNTAQREREQVYNRENEKVDQARAAANAATAARKQTESKIAALNKANQTLAEKYEISAKDLENQTVDFTPYTPTGGATGSGAGSGRGGGSTATVDKFKAEKEWRERQEALNRIAYATGVIDYQKYTERMNEITAEFYQKQLAHTDLSENERLTISAQYAEEMKKRDELDLKRRIAEEKQGYEELKAETQQDYLDGKLSKQAYDMQMENIEFAHLRALVEIQEEGTEERLQAEANYRQRLMQDMERRRKETEDAEKKHQDELKKLKEEYFGNNAQENLEQYNAAMANLDEVYQAEVKAAGDNAAEKLRIDEAYEKAKLALKKKYNQAGSEADRNAQEKWNQDLLDWLNGDGGQALTKSVEALTSGMSSIFSQLSSLVQAEMEIETAAIEKRYEREVSMAEGNKYKTKQLEKQKQKEVAKVKDEANRKLFAMQVIQAVAQTATAALNAYSSAAAIPVVGYVIAPIAAAMAVAAGMMQVAAIKKQQQASQAQGYAEGGFTRPGRVDEVAGVVHAGEWVASQKLLASPVARPLIEALDYAQRTNTIGSLRQTYVSRTITVPAVLAQSQTPTVIVQENNALRETIARLNERLNEPFVTVNTVTGDLGIKQAQDDYQRLMNNKSPKNMRK